MEASFTESLSKLYKDPKITCVKDDYYLMNLDYLSQFPGKHLHTIGYCMEKRKEPKFAYEKVTKESTICQQLVADATKSIEIKFIHDEIKGTHWDDARNYIVKILRQYAMDNGRVCLRSINIAQQPVAHLKMLSIRVYYGHYMYAFVTEDESYSS